LGQRMQSFQALRKLRAVDLLIAQFPEKPGHVREGKQQLQFALARLILRASSSVLPRRVQSRRA
jgi:hypothetical protein